MVMVPTTFGLVIYNASWVFIYVQTLELVMISGEGQIKFLLVRKYLWILISGSCIRCFDSNIQVNSLALGTLANFLNCPFEICFNLAT